MKKWRAILTMLTMLAPCAGFTAEIGGITMPDTLTVGNEALVLNGAGLRTKMFIKVYAGGLYLKEKTGDAARIIDADAAMAFRMHFIHDGVSAEKLVAAWNEGFVNSTGNQTAAIQKEIDQFNGFFTSEAKKDDVYEIVYTPGQGVSTAIKGKPVGVIPGLAFKKALFGIWLGEKPADDGLKKGMLGP